MLAILWVKVPRKRLPLSLILVVRRQGAPQRKIEHAPQNAIYGPSFTYKNGRFHNYERQQLVFKAVEVHEKDEDEICSAQANEEV